MTRKNIGILKLIEIDARKSDTSTFIHKVHLVELESDIYLSFCYFNIKNFDTSLYSSYGIDFPDEIKRSVNKRQAEFFAGRYCVKNSLTKSKLTNNAQGVVVGIGHNRSPIWPKGIIGSITHTDNAAVSIIAPDSAYTYLGVDIEKIMPIEQAHDIKTTILTTDELKKIDSIYPGRLTLPLNILITLIFSAKESLFKALYKNVQSYFDFNVAFTKKIDLESLAIYMSIEENFAKKYQLSNCYKLNYNISEEYVMTTLVSASQD